MSNYYQEDTHSDTENEGYDSEEGKSLGLSILDYEKIDLESGMTTTTTTTKRPRESDVDSKRSASPTPSKKIRIEKEKEDGEGEEATEDVEDDYLLSCPICLEHFSNKTLLNPCYHAFCYICIKKWSKVSQCCPLCKQKYNFAIFNIKDEYNFDKVYFGEDEASHKKQRSSSYFSSSSQGYRNKTEKEKIEYRREFYIKDLYSKQTEKYKVLKDNQTYLDYFSKNKSKFNRIIPWIERDLKAILYTEDITIVRDFILSVLRSYDLNSEKAREEISAFLNTKTNHFIHELKCFINSPFNIETYDSQNQYEKKSEHKIPKEAVDNYFLTRQKLKEKEKTKILK